MLYVLLTWLFAPIWGLVAYLRKWASPEPRRVAVLEIAGIGDVVCSTAVFRALRTRFPKADIDLFVEPFAVDIIALDPNLSRVVVWSSKRLRGLSGRFGLAWRLRAYDTLVCLNPGAAQLTAACWAAMPRRLSVLPEASKWTYALLRPLLTAVSKHARNRVFVQTQLDLLRALGIQCDDRQKSLTIPEAENWAAHLPPGCLVGIAVGSGLALKEIPEEILGQVIAALLDRKTITVVLIGGEKEREKGRRLASRFLSAIDLTGRTSLPETAAVLKKLAVFVGVNSGITHIANALHVSIVCLGGPSDTNEQGPEGDNVIILARRPPCAPCDQVFATPCYCQTGTRECVTEIGAREIIGAIDTLCLHYQGQRAQLLQACVQNQ